MIVQRVSDLPYSDSVTKASSRSVIDLWHNRGLFLREIIVSTVMTVHIATIERTRSTSTRANARALTILEWSTGPSRTAGTSTPNVSSRNKMREIRMTKG